jgi:3,4-dihydroxy 2-butanone 4-phosphate synthase/GTP cyclohydrolase II
VLQRHRLHHGDGTRPRVTRGATVGMPTAHGLLRATGYRDELGGVEHLALAGGPTTGVPLVGVHVECLLGEVFGSLACSCAHRLDASLQRVAAEGGVVVYVRRSRGSHVRNATTTAAAHTGQAGRRRRGRRHAGGSGQTEVRLVRGAVTADDLAPAGLPWRR